MDWVWPEQVAVGIAHCCCLERLAKCILWAEISLVCDPNFDLVEDKRYNCVWRQKRGIEIPVVALERISKRLRLVWAIWVFAFVVFCLFVWFYRLSHHFRCRKFDQFCLKRKYWQKHVSETWIRNTDQKHGSGERELSAERWASAALIWTADLQPRARNPERGRDVSLLYSFN